MIEVLGDVFVAQHVSQMLRICSFSKVLGTFHVSLILQFALCDLRELKLAIETNKLAKLEVQERFHELFQIANTCLLHFLCLLTAQNPPTSRQSLEGLT